MITVQKVSCSRASNSVHRFRLDVFGNNGGTGCFISYPRPVGRELDARAAPNPKKPQLVPVCIVFYEDTAIKTCILNSLCAVVVVDTSDSQQHRLQSEPEYVFNENPQHLVPEDLSKGGWDKFHNCEDIFASKHHHSKADCPSR